MKTKLLTIALLFNTLLGFAEKPFKCTLKGVIIDRDSKVLFLAKISNSRLKSNMQSIPIHDNTFEYVLEANEIEAYQLVFEDEYNKGAYHSIVFFPFAGEINFRLHSFAEFKKDEITGGQLNKEYAVYQHLQDNLFGSRSKEISNKRIKLDKDHEYYSPARDSIISMLRKSANNETNRQLYLKMDELTATGNDLTSKGKIIKNEQDILTAETINWKYGYISNNPTELSYYLILRDVNYFAKDDKHLAAIIKKAYPIFAAKYANHSYTKIIADQLNGIFNVKAGEQLIDLSAPDLRGKTYRLSDLAKGKITLVDLWGSWCSPCIAATQTMMPVYNEFKDKGFSIVGIAREFKTTKNLAIALKREKYPWLNLVELDDRNEIWNKYGISMGTGLMVLVDKNGKIIAVNPTAEAVRKVLLASL